MTAPLPLTVSRWLRANLGADVAGAMARGRSLLADVAADPTR